MIKLKKIYKLIAARTVRGIYLEADLRSLRNMEFESELEVTNYINNKIIPKIEELDVPASAILNTHFRIEERYKLDI